MQSCMNHTCTDSTDIDQAYHDHMIGDPQRKRKGKNVKIRTLANAVLAYNEHPLHNALATAAMILHNKADHAKA